ncbi:MAG TPA: VWA domain-containing protein [Chitinophagaceae bacterium]|nr:VWA domain-containing protein [Chitinophagaceae bacterium]
MTIEFQYPQAIWLLAALPLFGLLFLFYQWWRKRSVKRFGDARLVQALMPTFSKGKTAFKLFLFLLAFALGCVAIANPRQPDKIQEDARAGIDVVLALDVSNSMLATDVAPSRLARAKAVLSKLVDQLPDDRIALVLFAGNAYIQMPLTTDHNAARLFISTASPAVVTAQGTAIGEALERSSFAFGAESERFKTVVLLSDGETHDENAALQAQELAAKGVMVNSVGIGLPEGGSLFDTASNAPRRDAAGNVIITKLNEALLQQIATTTNGIYRNLDNTDKTVASIVQQLSQVEKKALGDTSHFTYRTFYIWLVLPMLLLLVMDLFLGDRKKKAA